jgi:hypothetical protein
MKKFNIEDERLLTTETRKKNENIKFNMLYEKAKIKNEMIKLIQEKNNELKVKQELVECTFTPKINRKDKQDFNIQLTQNQPDALYYRNINWNRQIKEKYKL